MANRNTKLRSDWNNNLESRIGEIKLKWRQKVSVRGKSYMIVDLGPHFTSLEYAKMRYAISCKKPLGILIHEDYDFTVRMIARANIMKWLEYNDATRADSFRRLELYMQGKVLSILHN